MKYENDVRTFLRFDFPFGNPIEVAAGQSSLGAASSITDVETYVALVSDGTVKCRRVNGCGRPWVKGEPTFDDSDDNTIFALKGLPKLKAVSLGCVVGENGLVYCWGPNSTGQLGTGKVDWFNGTFERVKDLTGVTKIVVNPDHRCAIDEKNDLWCWGSNKFGAIGNGKLSTGSCVDPYSRIDYAGETFNTEVLDSTRPIS